MYEVTNDPALLNEMICYADQIRHCETTPQTDASCEQAGANRCGLRNLPINGPVTATEMSSFKSFMLGETPPNGQTYDNSLTDTLTGNNA
jgi:hypothetical protein